MDNSHFKFSDAENIEMIQCGEDKNMRELEMEYMQVLSDCDSVNNSAANSDAGMNNSNPNAVKKCKSSIPSKTKSSTLHLKPEKEPPLESVDSNFTSFGAPSVPSTE